jgi:hypothetical protein
MIWFTCKQCAKTHGRPESSIGAMVFCECGQGNLVPWESTSASPPESAEPAATPEATPASEKRPVRQFEAVPVDEEREARPGVSRSRRRSRYAPDPNFCLNHERIPSQKTCDDCGEAFCRDCTLLFQGVTLCGPCKNHRVRSFQRSPRLSTLALVSVLLALVSAPLAISLVGAVDNLVVSLIALASQVLVLSAGVLAWQTTDANAKLRGRNLAVTAIVTAGISSCLTAALALFSAGMLT